MKIIFLNAWQGQVLQIKDFILENISTTDVFCFQEAGDFNTPIFCQDYLSNQYQLFTDSKIITEENIMVQATFIKKQYQVLTSQTLTKNEENIGLGLFTQIKSSDNQFYNLINIHGFPWPGDKQDNPNRIKQSQLIIDFMKKYPQNQIVGGDFNLDFNTKSVNLFEENNYKNLIKEFNIKSTRNQISWADYSPEQQQKFADYAFVSHDLNIKSFTVPYNEVSDHLPMILEIY